MFHSDLLLVTTPFTQLNTAYPATQFLKGFLNQHNIKSSQIDLGNKTFCEIFSKNGLQKIFDSIDIQNITEEGKRIFALRNEYENFIDLVVKFLQGKNNSYATALCNNILPEGKRLQQFTEIDSIFGQSNTMDKAKFLATLFIEDIGDFIANEVDKNFGFTRYAEKICLHLPQFEAIIPEIETETIITQIMLNILDKKIQQTYPRLIGFSIPFPGNLLSTLQCANYIRKKYPKIKIIIGGGYVSTELRQLKSTKIFQYVDFVCLDDGEIPLLQILKSQKGYAWEYELCRTFVLQNNKVEYINYIKNENIPFEENGTPDYDGIEPDNYISFLEIVNPMHRLWSDGWWNKLMLAHGCYWHACTFCDTTLNYIKLYSQTNSKTLVDRIVAILEKTGQTGFHFVDEAAPPAVLRELSLELLRRNIKISWWTNVRFEKTFSPDLCRLMAKAGCVAVSGGLEVASERLLLLINKGVSIENVAHVTHNFSAAGILVHAYLMYGFPTQTEVETIDSLEVVRQLFQNNLIKSGFWHRFALTVHSEISQNPEKFSIKLANNSDFDFSCNEIPYNEKNDCNHQLFESGLAKAIYNYMHGKCLDFPIQEWFNFSIPKTTVSPTLIENYIQNIPLQLPKNQSQVVWLGYTPQIKVRKKNIQNFTFFTKENSISFDLSKTEAEWLFWLIENANLQKDNKLRFAELEEKYNSITGNSFDYFFTSRQWRLLQKAGLFIV